MKHTRLAFIKIQTKVNCWSRCSIASSQKSRSPVGGTNQGKWGGCHLAGSELTSLSRVCRTRCARAGRGWRSHGDHCCACVSISARAMNVPRALITPFPMGRPIGAPGDATTQRSVTRAALDLLETAKQPGTLQDTSVSYQPGRMVSRTPGGTP